MKPAAFLVFAVGAIILICYTFYRTETKNAIFGHLMGQAEKIQIATEIDDRRTWPIPNHTGMEWAAKDEDIRGVLKKLDQMMPNVSFTDIKTTTSTKKSKATILNRKDSYCIGDPLTVQLDLYDHLGNRKEYGGDFLQARVYSSSLKAGAPGHIEDHKNGTYLVNFTLFWEGIVRASLWIINPSEGVSALWTARKRGYDKIGFRGKFLKGTLNVISDCGFNIATKEELCEYLDRRDKDSFYCVKPKNVSCEALVSLNSYNKPISYLSVLEKKLFYRSNIGAEIPQAFGDIRVAACGSKKTMANEKCRIGMTSPSPSGFVWQNQWHPVFCNVSTFNTLERINTCLEKKLIYLLGDSTVRQWIEYLTKRVNTLKYLDTHGVGKHRNLIAVDMARNIQIQWKKHNHPFVTAFEYMVRDHNYVTREIDQVAGDKDTVVVIGLGQHFRPFPIELFIRRMVNIREAIRRLLLRSPDTKVIIKAENTREMSTDQEQFGDFHGYAQYLALKDIFWDLKVGFVDAWDMTVAYATNLVHPPDAVVGSQIDMLLSYIC